MKKKTMKKKVQRKSARKVPEKEINKWEQPEPVFEPTPFPEPVFEPIPLPEPVPVPIKEKPDQEKTRLRTSLSKPMLILIAIIVVVGTMIITSYALFSGNHNLFINKTNAQDFCSKCHADKAATLRLGSNVHRNIGCSCHGYNPNVTAAYDINAAHNLTKNIYCTNCHTNYNNSTGNILIHGGTISAPNQSAHYLINNSNKNLIYQNAKEFFNNSKR